MSDKNAVILAIQLALHYGLRIFKSQPRVCRKGSVKTISPLHARSERAPDIVLDGIRRCGFRLEPDPEAERMCVEVRVVSDAGRKRARLVMSDKDAMVLGMQLTLHYGLRIFKNQPRVSRKGSGKNVGSSQDRNVRV
jgi:hypothetical protein